MITPLWLDAAGHPRPTQRCQHCGAEVSVTHHVVARTAVDWRAPVELSASSTGAATWRSCYGARGCERGAA
jgi:hypothetical protein